MDPDPPRKSGLSPTLRQMTILVLWAAILAATARAAIRWDMLGHRPEDVFMNVSLYVGMLGFPSLSLLILALDRPGKVKDWYYSCCMAASGVLPAVLFLLQDPACYALSGRFTPAFPLPPLLGLVCLWAAWKQKLLRQVRPGRCACCGRKAVITYAHPAYPGARMWIDDGKNGWCACCGALYAREARGGWEGVEAG